MIQEIRYAVRSLRKAGSFTTAAVLTLTLGIGAVTTMFAVLDGVLFKPLQYPNAARIVTVQTRVPDRVLPQLTGGDVMDIADRRMFDAFAYYQGGEMGVQLAGRAEFVGVRVVHPDFFRVFGVSSAVGRTFNLDDAGRSAVISSGFAKRMFGTAALALGRTVFIESTSYEIVGVVPASMQFPANTDVWAAGPLQPPNHNRTSRNYRTVAAMASGASIAGANADLTTVAAQLAAAFPDTNRNTSFLATPLVDSIVSQSRSTLYVWMGAVVLVLLIACANVANLLLARAAGRSREIAVRMALGASRARIVVHLLAESLVLSAVACALGLLLAYGGSRALASLGTRFVPLPRIADIHVDWRVLVFSIGVSVLTTIAFGLAPGLKGSRTPVNRVLNLGATRGMLGAASSRMRSALVVVQIALSCALAISAGLLFRSVLTLNDAPLGYDTTRMLVMYAHAPARGTGKAGLESYIGIGGFFDTLFVNLRQVPGVTGVAGVMGLPTGQYNSNGAYAVEGVQTLDGDLRRLPSAGFRLASPSYFATMGMPLVSGRDFSDTDLYDQPFVAIVSESLVRQSFGLRDPIGQRFRCSFDQRDKLITIVGVVGDVRQASPAADPQPEVYMPLRQHPYLANEVQVVMRSSVTPESLTNTVQRTVRAMNPDVAMKFTTLEASVSQSIATPRVRAVLLSTFAGLALLLAVAGVYAVMNYVTAQRTAEFGLRVALGARPIDVLRLVLGGALRLALLGGAAGLILALAASRLLASMLFGVTTTDGVTYAAVLLIAVPAVLAAAAVPAFRAARVDPMRALRSE